MEPMAKLTLASARQVIRGTQLTSLRTQPTSLGHARHFSYSPRARQALQSRRFHQKTSHKAQTAAAEIPEQPPESTNPALSFPCLDASEAKTASLSSRSLSSGPEPSYNA
ncbi:MAG: hypothetical protein Q9225_005741, partial [Loekoesia sp. 1 TL-2023]